MYRRWHFNDMRVHKHLCRRCIVKDRLVAPDLGKILAPRNKLRAANQQQGNHQLLKFIERSSPKRSRMALRSPSSMSVNGVISWSNLGTGDVVWHYPKKQPRSSSPTIRGNLRKPEQLISMPFRSACRRNIFQLLLPFKYVAFAMPCSNSLPFGVDGHGSDISTPAHEIRAVKRFRETCRAVIQIKQRTHLTLHQIDLLGG